MCSFLDHCISGSVQADPMYRPEGVKSTQHLGKVGFCQLINDLLAGDGMHGQHILSNLDLFCDVC